MDTSYIDDAISYPMNKLNLKDYIAATLLWLFSFLLIPLIYLYGYGVKVLQVTINDEELPHILNTNTKEMLMHGLSYIAILISYGLVSFLLAGIIVGPVYIFTESMLLLGIASLFGFFVIMAQSFVSFISIMIYADGGSIKSSFNFTKIKRILLSKEYLIAQIGVFIVSFTVSLIYTMITSIPLIGALIALMSVPFLPAISLFIQVTVFRFFGLVYNDITA